MAKLPGWVQTEYIGVEQGVWGSLFGSYAIFQLRIDRRHPGFWWFLAKEVWNAIKGIRLSIRLGG